jgi:hypothetical protein
MVRAILTGTKTQTRRIITSVAGMGQVREVQRSETRGYDMTFRDRRGMWNDLLFTELERRSPYGAPGERLWVREAWHSCPHCPQHQPLGHMTYRAGGWRTGTARSDDDARPLPPKCAAHGYKPSIHMKRQASRITLEVTGVRVERVQDISEADAKAEGVDATNGHPVRGAVFGCGPTYREGFAQIWHDINGAESWAANPYVWVVEFRRVKP